MNHIFRVIWNRTLRLWQCVSEKVKSTTKAGPNAAKTALGKVTASAASAGVALALLMPPTLGVAAGSLELTQAWMDNFYNTTEFYNGYNDDAKPIQGYGGNGNSSSNRWRFVLDNLELESLHVAADEVVKTGRIMPRFVGERSTLAIEGTWIAGVNQQTIASWALWTDSNRHDTVVTGLLVAGHASGEDEFYDVNTGRVTYTSDSRLNSNHLLLGDFSSTNPATQETFTVKGNGKVLVENVLSVYTYVPSPPDRFLSAISGRLIPQLVPSSGASFTINLEENGVIDAAGLKFGQGFNVNNAHASATFNQTGAGSRLEISTARGIERLADTDLGRNPPGTRGDLAVTMNFKAGEMLITRPKGTYNPNKRVLFNGFNTDTNLANRDKVVFGESADDTYTLNLDLGVAVSQYRYAGFEGQGTLVKKGWGAWVLTADNSRFTGTLQIDEGTIAIGGYGWDYTSTFSDPFSRTTDRTLLNDAGFKTTGTSTTLPNPLPSARVGQDWQFGGRVKVGLEGTLEYSPVGDHAFNSSAAKMTFNWDTEVESNGIVRIFTYDNVNLLGKHTYGENGLLMINSGHVTLTGTGEIAGEGYLSIGNSAQVYRYSPTYYPGASLTLLGTDQATLDLVALADVGDGSLILDHSTLTLNYLVHGWPREYKATFEMKNDSTLRIGGSTDRADPRLLFLDFNTASGRDTISSVGNNRLDVTGYAEQVANAGFSGSGTLTKAGDGTLIISANNDRFEGTWIVADGVLQWGNNVDLNGENAPTLNSGTSPAVKLMSALADEATDRYQGTFAFGHSSTYTLASDLFGGNTEEEKAGNLRMAGTGTLVVTGAQTYRGQTQIRNGTISLQGSNTLSDLLGQSDSAIDTGVSDTEKGVLEIRRAQDDDEFDRLITGKGSFTKAGIGTVTLTGGSQEDGDFYDYEGNTAVRGGELVLETGKKIDSATGGAASNLNISRSGRRSI